MQWANIAGKQTALSITNKISECECKKNNIIVYNLLEASEHYLDDQNFADLCKAIVKIDLDIEKMFRIGCKNSNRSRLLLVCRIF